jgi:YD repeat-containing protein
MSFNYSAPYYFVSKVTTPDGNTYNYIYNNNGNLDSTTFPDHSIRKYGYIDNKYPSGWVASTYLSGITDENGAQYASFSYTPILDANGYTWWPATSTSHAGGADSYTVDYSYYNEGVVGVTSPLGAKTWYLLQGLNNSPRQTMLARACNNCNSVGGQMNFAYDASGNPSQVTDFNNNVNSYAYDLSRNLETSRTLGAGSSVAQTITTSWHPQFRLPTQIVDVNRTLTFIYDSQGNATSVQLSSSTYGTIPTIPGARLSPQPIRGEMSLLSPMTILAASPAQPMRLARPPGLRPSTPMRGRRRSPTQMGQLRRFPIIFVDSRLPVRSARS